MPEEVTVAGDALAAKGEEGTVAIEVGDVLAITSWFVVGSGRNPRQVKAMVEEVESAVAAVAGRRPERVEGIDTWEWVLMDYGDFVVHAFQDDVRRHYEIERLYGDVPHVAWAPGVGSGGRRGSR